MWPSCRISVFTGYEPKPLLIYKNIKDWQKDTNKMDLTNARSLPQSLGPVQASSVSHSDATMASAPALLPSVAGLPASVVPFVPPSGCPDSARDQAFIALELQCQQLFSEVQQMRNAGRQALDHQKHQFEDVASRWRQEAGDAESLKVANVEAQANTMHGRAVAQVRAEAREEIRVQT